MDHPSVPVLEVVALFNSSRLSGGHAVLCFGIFGSQCWYGTGYQPVDIAGKWFSEVVSHSTPVKTGLYGNGDMDHNCCLGGGRWGQNRARFYMGKALLSLMLVVTQVVPWTASPLFLCLASDGSVCLDAGPAACTCCRDHEHDEDACCGRDTDKERHEDGPSRVSDDRGGEWVSDADCNCAHVLLSQDARVVRRMRVDDDVQSVVPLLTTFVSAVGTEVPAPTLASFSGLMCRDASSLLPSERAPFVLRC
jgi:hypothetical protein